MAEMIDIFPSQYNSVKFNLYFQSLSTFLGKILMKWIVISALIGLILSLMVGRVSHSQEAPQDSQFEQALREARQVSKELAEKVRGLLLQEIERGGFVNAVRVCSEVAQEITQQFNKDTGQYARRVSLRYRNPKNISDDYERRKLEEFDFLNHEKRLGNEYVEVVKEEDKEYLRYMRPLVAIPLCLVCHGPKENIPSEIKAMLAEKYPDDRATGFSVGDVRGTISVKIALPYRGSR
jgi:hypothetical protein